MSLAWGREVPGDSLIRAPLAVAAQTQREGAKFGIDVALCRSQADVRRGINVANYEMLEHFDPAAFAGVVLDESSILKSYTGSVRNEIISAFGSTPYRLACTATPAPNDYMELGNHCEFLGVMSRVEMLSMFFVHDSGKTQDWRLKGHAEDEFWKWVCSWAVMLRRPSDLGHSDEGFILPELRWREHLVPSDVGSAGLLFDIGEPTLHERRALRRASIGARVARAVELWRAEPDRQWLFWCDLNDEANAIQAAVPGCVQVSGSDERVDKETRLLGFAESKVRVLVTKPRIGGFGMNWQACDRMAFVGLSDSYEALYQCVRRCWRFGQKNHVEVHIVTADGEGAVLHNVKRKERDAEEMARAMIEHMKAESIRVLRGTERTIMEYERDEAHGEGWTVHLGDCIEVVREMPDDSIDFSVFSPPFASLYTYSNSERDMGNCEDDEAFMDHFKFLVAELYRVVKRGRLVSFHCMNLPSSKTRDGVIGLKDFRGDLIRVFLAAGWIYHSEVCIWKDPVTAMQRTKALGLLHKQIRKDSSMSRQGIPDYVVTMRKPGVNASPISHTADEFPVSLWQKWASPIWDDIQPGDVLSAREAREEKDERHLCCLQLEVIKRCIGLWSNPGDLVLSPFCGVGSEGYVSIEYGRRFVGVELKRSYWEQACANLKTAALNRKQTSLFA